METNAGRIHDGVYDRRRRPIHGELSDALGAVRAVDVAKLLKKYPDRRDVRRGRHDVIRHLIFDHAAVLPDDLLVEREAARLWPSSPDLSLCQNRVKNLSHIP